MIRSFDISFDLCLNKRLSKQLRWKWFKDGMVLIMTSPENKYILVGANLHIDSIYNAPQEW